MTNISTQQWHATCWRTAYPRISKAICLLVEHHKDILKSRFPDYEYKIYECPNDWLRIEISDQRIGNGVLLVASFSSSSIKIANQVVNTRLASPSKDKLNARTGLPMTFIHIAPNFTEEISYADPKFTDDMLSDILEGLILDRRESGDRDAAV